MGNVLRSGAAALVLVAPLAARAGPAVSVRSGWAVPFGDAVGDQPMNTLFDGFVPVQLDVALEVAERLQLGVYAQYGFVRVECGDDAECSGRGIRVGAQAVYTLAGAAFAPWLGAGAGFEHARHETTRPNLGVPGSFEFTRRSDLNGWELNVQGGGDWTVFPRLKVGPYLLLAAGRYERGSGSTLANRSVHAWFHLGVRCTYAL